jgi:hypothetical protein
MDLKYVITKLERDKSKKETLQRKYKMLENEDYYKQITNEIEQLTEAIRLIQWITGTFDITDE